MEAETEKRILTLADDEDTAGWIEVTKDTSKQHSRQFRVRLAHLSPRIALARRNDAVEINDYFVCLRMLSRTDLYDDVVVVVGAGRS